MKRRELLKLGVLGAVFPAAGPAFAGLGCQPTPNPAFQICRAGINSNVAAIIAREQQRSQWCWAACIEMILAHHGFFLDQASIVAATWGGVVNMPASDHQIMQDLNRRWIDNNGRQFTTYSQPVPSGMAAQELANGLPLIVCTQGHAMVLTSLLYQLNNFTGQGQDIEAVVRDPWQNNGRKILNAQEWYGRNLLLGVRCV